MGGVTKFACVDGPDFDGHQVDWDLLMARQRTYLDEEKRSLEQWQCQCAAAVRGGKTMAKLNLNRVEMPRQEPKVRAQNFKEVALGYTPGAWPTEEASRCIQCPKRPCIEGCPVGVDIPDFIKALREGNMPEAVRVLKSKNALPGICGRVCPQETQCEAVCTLAKKGAPIAIGRLERFVADWERANMAAAKPPEATPRPPARRWPSSARARPG